MGHLTELDRVMSEQGRMNVWLAAQVGAAKSSVTRWRQGKTRPAASTRRMVALALGRSVKDADSLFACPEGQVPATRQTVKEAA